MYYLGREDPTDAYLQGKSWHIVGPEYPTAVAMFDTWLRAKEYLDFLSATVSDPCPDCGANMKEHYALGANGCPCDRHSTD